MPHGHLSGGRFGRLTLLANAARARRRRTRPAWSRGAPSWSRSCASPSGARRSCRWAEEEPACGWCRLSRCACTGGTGELQGASGSPAAVFYLNRWLTVSIAQPRHLQPSNHSCCRPCSSGCVRTSRRRAATWRALTSSRRCGPLWAVGCRAVWAGSGTGQCGQAADACSSPESGRPCPHDAVQQCTELAPAVGGTQVPSLRLPSPFSCPPVTCPPPPHPPYICPSCCPPRRGAWSTSWTEWPTVPPATSRCAWECCC